VNVIVDFAELSLKPGRIMEAMGYAADDFSAVPLEMVRSALLQAAQVSDVRGYVRIIDPVDIDCLTGIMLISKKQFAVGETVAAQLTGSSAAAVFVCTAGEGISDMAREQLQGSDPVTGYVLDTIGSEMVERAMDLIQEDLGRTMQDTGMRITNRFSPGYCSWPVSDQQTLFSLIPRHTTGVRLTRSSLMQPVKSISGVLGVGKNVRYVEYGCSLCDRKDCIRRKQRIHS
jgi:hypothetical protein